MIIKTRLLSFSHFIGVFAHVSLFFYYSINGRQETLTGPRPNVELLRRPTKL